MPRNRSQNSPQDSQDLDTLKSIQEITQLIDTCEEEERDEGNKRRLGRVKTLLLTTLARLLTQNQSQQTTTKRL